MFTLTAMRFNRVTSGQWNLVCWNIDILLQFVRIKFSHNENRIQISVQSEKAADAFVRYGGKAVASGRLTQYCGNKPAQLLDWAGLIDGGDADRKPWRVQHTAWT